MFLTNSFSNHIYLYMVCETDNCKNFRKIHNATVAGDEY